MASIPKFICGLYASAAEAERVRNRLVDAGFPGARIRIFSRIRVGDHSPQLENADGLLKDVMVDSARGAVVGTALGVLAEVALAAANVTLFVASPVVAPLAMIGWGAALGGLFGGAVGANGPKISGTVADLILYGIRHGHVTLVVEATSDAEFSLVSAEIGEAIVDENDRRVTGNPSFTTTSMGH